MSNIIFKQNTKRIILSEKMGKELIDRVHRNFGHIGD